MECEQVNKQETLTCEFVIQFSVKPKLPDFVWTWRNCRELFWHMKSVNIITHILFKDFAKGNRGPSNKKPMNDECRCFIHNNGLPEQVWAMNSCGLTTDEYTSSCMFRETVWLTKMELHNSYLSFNFATWWIMTFIKWQWIIWKKGQ